ncbi:MAG: hypothetical protein KGL39_29005 [Patescibacteria group bacterium]|nr:hypothetical protein [Patescibacteria group bacterium]
MKKLPSPYFEKDGIILYHGDCLEIGPLVRGVDMVLTDPPFKLDVKHSGTRRARKIHIYGDSESLEFSSIGFDVLRFSDLLFSAKIAVVFHSRMQLPQLVPEMARRYAYFDLHVWHKPDSPPFTQSSFKHDLQYIGVGWTKVKHKLVVPEQKSKLYSGTHGSHASKNHPCSLPLDLVMRYLKVFGPECVLEPFCGGGSVLMAAKMLGIRAVGIEREERWCEVTAKWLETGATSNWHAALGVGRFAGRKQWSRYAL